MMHVFKGGKQQISSKQGTQKLKARINVPVSNFEDKMQ